MHSIKEHNKQQTTNNNLKDILKATKQNIKKYESKIFVNLGNFINLSFETNSL